MEYHVLRIGFDESLKRPELRTFIFKPIAGRYTPLDSKGYDVTYMSDDSLRKLIADNCAVGTIIEVREEAIAFFPRFKDLVSKDVMVNKVAESRLDNKVFISLRVINPMTEIKGSMKLHDYMQSRILEQHK